MPEMKNSTAILADSSPVGPRVHLASERDAVTESKVRALSLLWKKDSIACENLREKTWSFTFDGTITAGGREALFFPAGMVFSVNEEGAFDCVFEYDYYAQSPLRVSFWTWAFTFYSACDTLLASLDSWRLSPGFFPSFLPILNPWQQPQPGDAAIVLLPWTDSGFSAFSDNQAGHYRIVRSGVSAELRRDFDRLTGLNRNFKGLFW